MSYIRQATKTDKDTYVGSEIMGNKLVSKVILAEHGLSVPRGGKYSDLESALANYQVYFGKKIVIKPTTSNYGLGIQILKCDDKKIFQQSIKAAFQHDDSIIVEEFIEGQEYRFLVIGKKVISVLNRIPANVIGNGKDTVIKLVKIKNLDPNHFKSAKAYIRTGQIEKNILSDQKFTFKSIPKNNQQVWLRHNSNISTGGDPIDVTDETPKKFKEVAIRAAQALGGHICGIDIIIKGDNYSIIEANYNPSLYIHEVLYSGKSQNTPLAVLKYLGY